MPFTISLTDYKMLHPDTAEFPTLSQSGMLAVLLEKRRRRLVRMARQAAKRRARWQAVRTWLARGTDSTGKAPAFVAGSAGPL